MHIVSLTARLILTAVFSLCIGTAAAAPTQCREIPSGKPVPGVIAQNDCLQYSGRAQITGPLDIYGHLILSRRADVSFTGQELRLYPGGALTVRGKLSVDQGSLILDDDAALTNHGTLHLGPQTMLQTAPKAQVHNGGLFEFDSAAGSLCGLLENRAQIRLYSSLLALHSAHADNGGSISLQGLSALNLNGQTVLTNRGSLEADSKAEISLTEDSRLINRRYLNILGAVSQHDRSRCINLRQVTVGENALWYLEDQASLINEQLLEFFGQAMTEDLALIENRGSFYAEEGSHLHCAGKSTLRNQGNFRARGTVSRADEAVFDSIREWVK